MATRIGSAFVDIEANTSLFRTQATAGIAKALAGIEGKIPVTADTAAARTQIDLLKTRMTALNKQLAEVKIGANGKPAEATIRKLQLQLASLAETVAHITMEADTTKLDAEIAREMLQLAKLREAASSLKIDADAKAAFAKIAVLKQQIEVLRAKAGDPEALALDVAAWRAKVQAALAQIKLLQAYARKVVIGADNRALLTAIAVSEGAIDRMNRQAADMKIGGAVDLSNLSKAELELLGLEDAASKLNPELKAVNQSLVAGGRAFGRFGLGALTARVALYGGLTAVSGFHIALDVIIETLAVLVPALVTAGAGLLAFGLAGSDAARSVANQLKNVHTVADAFNTTIPPMTGNLEKLHAVVRPQVWQLYGDAITIAGTHGGEFNKLAIATGQVVDTLAAKLTNLITGAGPGLKNFLASGARDLQQFARILSNLGDAFGKLIQISQRTGIAEALLSIVNAGAKLFDLFTKLPIPLLTAIIAFHGIYLWSGLAATGILRMIGPLSKIAASVAGTKAAGKAVEELSLAGGGTKIALLGATFKDLGSNLKALPGRVVSLAKSFGLLVLANPWVVIGVVAVAALVGFTLWMGRGKDATDKLIISLNRLVTQSTIFNVINATGAALIGTFQALTAQQTRLGVALSKGNDAAIAQKYGLAAAGTEAFNAAVDAKNLTAAHQQLSGQLLTETTRLTQVAKLFGGGKGGLAGAMALAALAGVSVNELLSDKKGVWAAAVQKIAGVVAGYANMGVGSTQLGNAINVLTISQSDQLKSIENLNSAYDNFDKILTGPVTGFITFANTLKRFNTDAGVAGASLSGLGTGFTAVSHKVTDASLQLQSDFQDTFNASTQLADSMRLTGAASSVQIQGIKDAVQVLIPMAGTSKIAAAEISALAQEAGGPATTNLQSLAKWAGKTKDPLGSLQKVSDNAAVAFANMSTDAKKLGTSLSQDLGADSAKAVENAVGLQDAMNKFAIDLQNSGTSITQTNADRRKLIADLAAVGVTGDQANAIIAAISGQLQNVKGPVNDAAAAFEKFAGKGGRSGLGLTTTQADTLWKKLNDQNLTILGGKVDITKDKFIQFARKSLDLTTTQADTLWKHLQQQYLDVVGRKADTTKGKFEQLAKEGLNLDIAQADALWRKLQDQRLDEVGRKADTTRTKFEQLASQIGVNTTKADLWYTALKLIPNSVSTKISVDANGFVKVNGVEISAGAFFSPHAAGGFISGGVPNKDSVGAMLMPGEVVVPTKMVNEGAVDHLRGRLPGFSGGGQVKGYASGGKVGDTGNLTMGFPSNAYNATNNFAMDSTIRIAVAATKALAAFAANGLGGSGPAIVNYARSFLNKIPYVFGGNSLSSGLDCSAFVQQIYGHFGIHAPRTSESQFAWANKSAPVPGGLAFYVSPAGGPPPGHVAIVQDKNSVISQGGGLGPVIQSLKFLPLMGTGVPPGGLPGAGGGTGNQAIAVGGSTSGSLQQIALSLLRQHGWGADWPAFNSLENREAGWNLTARNPSSGAYGLAQFINGPSEYYQYGGNPTTGVGQLTAMMNYIQQRYGNPDAAWNHESLFGWYGAGGVVPGYATGGPVTTGGPAATAAYRKMLAAEQSREGIDYLGLRRAFLRGPAKYRSKPVMAEIETMFKRQGAEQVAYKHLSGAGLTAPNLAKLGAAARAESSTALDKALNATPGGHPGWAKGLRYWLGQLSTTASKGLPGGQVTSGPGGAGLPAITHTYGGDIANNIGAFISKVAPFAAGGMVQSYDNGGWLRPGFTMAYNGTGRSEAVSPAGSGPVVTFEITPSGNAFDAFLISWLKKNVKVKGGGNVQKAWGSHLSA